MSGAFAGRERAARERTAGCTSGVILNLPAKWCSNCKHCLIVMMLEHFFVP